MVDHADTLHADMFGGGQLPADITFSLDPVAIAARWIFRGDAAAAGRAGAVFGVALPQAPCEAAHAAGRAALWLGPDEWLLLDSNSTQPGLAAEIARALGELPHALVDVTHRQTALELTGANAARVLSAGCPLDFYRTAFPVDQVVRSIFMKMEIVIWRRDETRFHVEIGRSFARYFVQHAVEASRHAPAI